MNIGTVTTWTDARVAELKAFLAEGYSSSQIAVKLGHATRNAVIGKIHRLRLSRVGIVKKIAPRAPRQAPVSKPRQRYTPESKRVTTVFDNITRLDLRTAEIEPLHVSLVDLKSFQCRWAYGDSNFTFCGHEQMEGSSYCLDHLAISKRRMT
jgi:GcrA cell cycle regulator